jgi:phosphohistidine phosphatase SixA
MSLFKLSILACVVSFVGITAKADSISLKEALDRSKYPVFFLRHALAPGYGDPPDFNIDNCKTQRNLNLEGKDQATSIGIDLKSIGISFDKIYSSEWCRCTETASFLNLGEVTTFSGLNSFFQDHYNREETLAKLMNKLESLDKNDRFLMVTHQVVISAITGINVASGEAVAYNPSDGSALKLSMR